MNVYNLRDHVKFCGLDRGKLFSSLLLIISVGGALALTGEGKAVSGATNVTLTWSSRYTFRCVPLEEQGDFPWDTSTFTWEDGSHDTIANAFPTGVKYPNDSYWEFNRNDGVLTLLRADHRNTGSLTCTYGRFGSFSTRETKYNIYVIDRPLQIDICNEESNGSNRYNITVSENTKKVNFTCAKYGVSNHHQLGLRAQVTVGRGKIRMASQLQKETNEDGSSSVSMQFDITLVGEQSEVSCSLTDNGKEVENTTVLISLSHTGSGALCNGARRTGLAAWIAVLSYFVVILVGT